MNYSSFMMDHLTFSGHSWSLDVSLSPPCHVELWTFGLVLLNRSHSKKILYLKIIHNHTLCIS